jgi:hypothetical protein
MIPRHCEAALTDSAIGVISSVCQKQMGMMKRPPVSEVDFVASLIENGVDMLEHAWNSILVPVGVEVSVAGVFCHQSPKVEIAGTPPRSMRTQICELADLLILHSHRTAGNKSYNRGTLVQTKMHSRPSLVPDDPQFWLYDSWPSFSMRAPGFDPRLRDFGADRRSGRYALVSNYDWQVMPPINPLCVYDRTCLNFGTFLVRMLYDMDPQQPCRTSRHGRQVYCDSSKDWSKTVWDILSVTAKIVLKHMGKKAGLYNSALPARSGGHVVSLLPGGHIVPVLPDRPRYFIIPPKETADVDSEPPGGVSVLCIETLARSEE